MQPASYECRPEAPAPSQACPRTFCPAGAADWEQLPSPTWNERGVSALQLWLSAGVPGLRCRWLWDRILCCWDPRATAMSLLASLCGILGPLPLVFGFGGFLSFLLNVAMPPHLGVFAVGAGPSRRLSRCALHLRSRAVLSGSLVCSPTLKNGAVPYTLGVAWNHPRRHLNTTPKFEHTSASYHLHGSPVLHHRSVQKTSSGLDCAQKRLSTAPAAEDGVIGRPASSRLGACTCPLHRARGWSQGVQTLVRKPAQE